MPVAVEKLFSSKSTKNKIASGSPTIDFLGWAVKPAFIAGATRRVLWMRQKL
jgi:hypothetical protein